MFCRLGLTLESRPVAATVCLKVVCRRPVRGSMYVGERLEVGVEQLGQLAPLLDRGDDGVLLAQRRAGRGRRSSSPSCPCAAARARGRPKSTSASCCGEPMVNGPPASSWTRSVSSSTRSRTRAVISPRRYGSMRTPARSMRASTRTSGSSTSRKSRSRPSSTSRGRWAAATRQVSAARAGAADGDGLGERRSRRPLPRAPARRPRRPSASSVRSFSGDSGASR